MNALRAVRVGWLCAATLLVLAGCDDGDGEDAGPADAGPPATDAGAGDAGPGDAGWVDVSLYTEVSLGDDELADQAIAIMVGTPAMPRCTTCHGLTPTRVTGWGTQTTDALTCIASLEPNVQADAEAILACFTDEATGMPDATALGLVSTATHLDWFQRAFDVAYEDDSSTERAIFLMRGQMPRPPGVELTQDEVDVLLTWAARGMPGLEDRLADDGGLDCELEVGPEVAQHIVRMETEGWDVVNRDASVANFGCDAGQTGSQCLTDFPDSASMAYADGTSEPLGLPWAREGTMRILHDYDWRSSFWTKSSADGRYVAMGGESSGGASSTIIDLSTGTEIPTEALYDPSFFPGNDGFVFQGTSGGVAFCRQSLLNANPMRVTFGEPECTTLGSAVGLYQHVGRINGGDFWTVYGQFQSDNGGHSVTRGAVSAGFDMGARTSIRPIIDTGTGFMQGERVRIDTPYEGDGVMSPSGRLVMNRARGMGGGPAGYVLRQMIPITTPGGYDVTLPQIGRYCGRGGKVTFSFDERYVVYHRYVTDDEAAELGYMGAGNPDFGAFRMQGAANVYLLDLFSGVTRRITHMAPGQYALFPHFRSDGWIYFQVRATVAEGATREFIVASDAALE